MSIEPSASVGQERSGEVTYLPPLVNPGPCATAKCGNNAQKYGNATGEGPTRRPSSPLCNVCLAKAEAARQKG